MTIRDWLERQRRDLAAGPRTLAELARVAGVGSRVVWAASRGRPVSPRIATRIEKAACGAVLVVRKTQEKDGK